MIANCELDAPVDSGVSSKGDVDAEESGVGISGIKGILRQSLVGMRTRETVACQIISWELKGPCIYFRQTL